MSRNGQFLKRVLRIMVGLPLSPIPMIVFTWVWLFTTTEETWVEGVGYYTWLLASGDWDKLPK